MVWYGRMNILNSRYSKYSVFEKPSQLSFFCRKLNVYTQRVHEKQKKRISEKTEEASMRTQTTVDTLSPTINA